MSQHDDKSPFDWDKWPFILPGCDPDGPEEDESSADLSASMEKKTLRRDAEIGLVSAQLELGLNLLYGKGGFAEDPQEAVKWLRAAAEQGDAEAQFNLGYCLQRGIGCKKNPRKAMWWFHAAAKQGNAEAQYEFGDCLVRGIDCKKNPQLG
ncbi:MAG: sel1 repeat family protein, partial [Thermoguttaceae bacterium]|nr:sel1 repeat family protein [Thermoguttaceae bacterium]